MKTICPIRPHDFSEFLDLVQKIDNRTDIIEIWLDEIQDLKYFFEKFKKLKQGFPSKKIEDAPWRRGPGGIFLAVCKTPAEKGSFPGNSADRVEILRQFLAAGGDWVDLDVTQNTPEEIQKIPAKKLFLSFHDFQGIPEDLEEILKKMQAHHPALYKFAVTTNTEEALSQFISFVQQFPKKTKEAKGIFTTMGKLGGEGREEIAKQNLSWGGFWALNQKSKTASGQKTLDDLPPK